MKVSKLLRQTLNERLAEKRVIVWYDAEQAFSDFAAQFEATNCQVICVDSSRLSARRRADDIFRKLNNAKHSSDAAHGNLLIYLPFGRGQSNEARRSDPFEVFAVAGDAFGDDEAERLQSLAHQALPDLATQIDRLFREGKPTLVMLDNLAAKGPAYPLLEEALGTQSPVEATIQVLGDAKARKEVEDLAGCGEELLRLLNRELDFRPPKIVSDWQQRWALLGRYVLFSEFAFDLHDELPDALANLPRANEAQRPTIVAIAEGFRDRASFRDAYLDLAQRVEEELQLAQHFDDLAQIGERDTFPFEEKLALQQLAQTVLDGDLFRAKEIIGGRIDSVWHDRPERSQRWRVADRCVALLEVAKEVGQEWEENAGSVAQMVSGYTAENGWYVLDRHQRLLEQSVAECPGCDDLESLIEFSRDRYREMIKAIQERFLQRVRQDGWPGEDALRQTQLFDRFVAPALERREKVAYILADALRFEMGKTLAGALAQLGETTLSPASGTLPAITPVGMAALMPGADGLLALREEGHELIPYLGQRRLKNIEDRRKFLKERFGDRIVDVEIGEFLSLLSAKKRAARLNDADLVVMRDSRIDRFGETVPGYEARKYITNLLGDLKTAATQLVRLGYSYIVIATDHGFVFFPEVRPGDTVEKPDGFDGWPLAKRRCLLGQQVQPAAGNHRFATEHVGIQAAVPDYVVPDGFKLYAHGSGYFHEGLSLQECVVPVITLRAEGQPAEQDDTGVNFELRYRQDTFTSQVIGVKAWYSSLLNPQLRVRIEAFGGSGADAEKVGEVTECDARDEVTREVVLTQNEETPVPVLLDPDFRGDSIEIRATDAETGVIYDRLKLKNGMLD